MEDIIRATAALLVVLAGILALGWGMRRFSNAAASRMGRESDLKIVEWRAMDSRRKLAVVQWDGKEHLLCLGPGGDCHVATRDALAEPESTSVSKTEDQTNAGETQ